MKGGGEPGLLNLNEAQQDEQDRARAHVFLRGSGISRALETQRRRAWSSCLVAVGVWVDGWVARERCGVVRDTPGTRGRRSYLLRGTCWVVGGECAVAALRGCFQSL